MNTRDDLRAAMNELKRAARRKAESARRRATPRTVNISQRRNIVVATNIGEDGGAHIASARQSAPISQDGDG